MEIAGDISPGEKEALAKEFRDLEEIRNREDKSRAVVLEILGDIPDADVTPPKNVLFVCKLNPVTEEGDLKIIFSRFGNVKKCDIIKDYVTGDSLQYAFIEFETEESCNEAYFKMQNVLIDDRRIHVDFCQSVSGFWKRYYYNDKFTRETKERHDYRRSDHNRHNHSADSKRSRKRDRKHELDETRPHHKHESEERKHSSRRKTRSSREGRVKRRRSVDSDRRRRSSSSSDSYSHVTRSSSRDTFGRRKDHRLNYTKRSISRGSISRSMSKDKVRSTSTSIQAMISSRRENRINRRRIGPRQRRFLRSGSRSQESPRRHRRSRSLSVGRTKKTRRTYSSSSSPESPDRHDSKGSDDEPSRKYRRRSTSSISSTSLNTARLRRSSD